MAEERLLDRLLDAAELPGDAIEVGRIVGAWGVKGWFKIAPHSASPEALLSSRRWFLQPTDRLGAVHAFTGARLVRVREAKEHGGTIVAQAQDVESRDAAEALKGARIFVPRASFPTPDKDEFYWVDLIGLEVVNREGVALGTVSELLSTGPQTVLVLDHMGEEGKPTERMIPFVDAFVDSVDLAARRIVADWQPDY